MRKKTILKSAIGRDVQMKKNKEVYVCSDRFGVLRIFERLQNAKKYQRFYEKEWPQGDLCIVSMPLLKREDKSLSIR